MNRLPRFQKAGIVVRLTPGAAERLSTLEWEEAERAVAEACAAIRAACLGDQRELPL
jgi:hypothetical protein